MVILKQFENVPSQPHLFKNLKPYRRESFKNAYILFKRGNVIYGLSYLAYRSGSEFCQDALACKIKKYGYKPLIGLTLGPAAGFISGVLYVYSVTKRIRAVSLMIHEIWVTVMNAKAGIADAALCPLDMFLFGEPVPMANANTFRFLLNETSVDSSNVVSNLTK